MTLIEVIRQTALLGPLVRIVKHNRVAELPNQLINKPTPGKWRRINTLAREPVINN
jgi:hypothetical protein